MSHKFELPFEQKYDYQYSKIYYLRHKKGILKRISNYLEQRMIAKALRKTEGSKSVLDLPCGAGRFLHTILNSGAEKVIAADKSPDMLRVIQEVFSINALTQVELMQTNVTNIQLPDKSVDCALCIRLIHHIHDQTYRRAIYEELQRVARRTVCISFWVDGNYKSFRESLRSKKSGKPSRCLIRAELEKELRDAGFTIIEKIDMLRPFLYWRTYVLRVK